MLSPKHDIILNSLARYKYLSRLQIARLGLEKYNSSISRYCKPLIEAKYIGVIDAINYGFGHIYYLTKKGARRMATENDYPIDSIHYCTNKPNLSIQSLAHRTHAIDCQIELFDSCTKEKILFYDRDFESLGKTKSSNKLERKTRIKLGPNNGLEPDAIFMLDTSIGRKLYCLEYEHKDFTKKSYQKVLLHLEALNLKSASRKYGHDKAHRTLFIYHNQATMKSIQKQLLIDVPDINSWFLFKSYDNIISSGKFKKSVYQMIEKKNYMVNWQQANGELKMLY